MFRGRRETFGQRQQAVEPHAFDLMTGIGGGAARILKHGRNESIIAGREMAGRHRYRFCLIGLRRCLQRS